MTIQGAGSGATTIDAGGIDRVFELSGVAGVVQISGLTVRGGRLEGDGAGMRIAGSANVTLANVILTDNQILNSPWPNPYRGAGVAFFGPGHLTVQSSQLTFNGISPAPSQPGALGGAIYQNGGTIWITQSTLAR